jgi:hypothetical protein
MSCVLSISGKELDIDAFVEQTGISGFRKSYKGHLRPGSKTKILEYFSASIVTSEADFNNLSGQIKDTETFLKTNKLKLSCITTTPGIDFANINFGVDSILDDEHLMQSFLFPPLLLSLCGELKLSLELTSYAF